MSKSDNAKDEIMTEQPLEENEKQHSASDKEDTGKKKTDGRQVKAAINVIRAEADRKDQRRIRQGPGSGSQSRSAAVFRRKAGSAETKDGRKDEQRPE